MEKALEVLTDMHSIYKGDHRITQALNEVKEAMKHKTCDGCKYQHESGDRDYHSSYCEDCCSEKLYRHEPKE